MGRPHTITPVDEGMVSHRGRIRTINEDSYGSFRTVLSTPLTEGDLIVLQRKGQLYIIADGMGGHDLGDLASATAVQQVCAGYYADPDDNIPASLQRVLTQVNSAIYTTAQTQRRPSSRPMGTTVTCAVIRDDTLFLAHVGDSRAYRLRDGTLTQLTQDHDWMTAQMRLHGWSRTEAEERAHQQGARGALLRAVGVQPTVQPDIVTLDWQAGDVLLLCSDGLHSLVSDDEIAHILRAQAASRAARELVAAANTAGGHDNITALVVNHTPITELAASFPRWRVVFSVLALSVVIVPAILIATTRISISQPRMAANGVLETVGWPTLQPTVDILPSATGTIPPATIAEPTSLPNEPVPLQTTTRPVEPTLIATAQAEGATIIPPSPAPATPTASPRTPAISPTTRVSPTIGAPSTPTLPPTTTPLPLGAAIMPDLVGYGESQAKILLGQLGVTPDQIVIDYQDRMILGSLFDEFPPYAVISTQPLAGQIITAQGTVTLGIRAPQTESAASPTLALPRMPDLVGYGEDQAKTVLAQLGIPAEQIIIDYQDRSVLGSLYDEFPAYVVVSTDPLTGAVIDPNANVTLGIRAP